MSNFVLYSTEIELERVTQPHEESRDCAWDLMSTISESSKGLDTHVKSTGIGYRLDLV